MSAWRLKASRSPSEITENSRVFDVISWITQLGTELGDYSEKIGFFEVIKDIIASVGRCNAAFYV